MWPEIIKFLGGTTVLLGATAWLIRSLVVHLLGKDIERFKQQLQTEAEMELVTLRATLEIENAKLQTKLAALEARRILFVEELYGLLVDVSGEADAFTMEPIHEDKAKLKEKANNFIDNFFEFYQYFEKHEIFVSEGVANQIKSLHDAHFRAALDIHYKEGNEQEKAIAAFKSGSKDILDRSSAIRRKLAAELRKVLGVES